MTEQPAQDGATVTTAPLPDDLAYVGLGSNLGDRAATLRSALAALGGLPDTRLLRCSTFHETQAVGGPPGQPPYLNAVAALRTGLSPRRLMEALLEIERRHGRVRTVRDAPRTLDLDLLLYGPRRIAEPGLTVPHPRMWQRDFVLRPLAELTDVQALRALFLPPAGAREKNRNRT